MPHTKTRHAAGRSCTGLACFAEAVLGQPGGIDLDTAWMVPPEKWRLPLANDLRRRVLFKATAQGFPRREFARIPNDMSALSLL